MEVVVLKYSYNEILLGYEEHIEVFENIDRANERIEELKKTVNVWDTWNRKYEILKRKVIV